MSLGVGTVVTATLVAVLLSTWYIYLKRLKTYWKRRNVPVVGDSLFYGLFKDGMTLKQHLSISFQKAYEANKDLKYFGTYMMFRPTLIVRDPEIIKSILVKDFNNFNSHGFNSNPKDPLSNHLFNLDGKPWKNMRNKLSSVFTSGKIKYMFEAMQGCIEKLPSVIDKHIENKGNVTNIKEILACLGTDVIASVAFGIEVNSLENPETEFRKYGRMLFNPSFKEFLRFMTIINAKWIMKLFNITSINSQSHKFIMQMVKSTVNYREQNNIVRNDFLHLAMQLKNKGYIEVDGKETAFDKDKNTGTVSRITLDELAAQVFIFYAAGFETTSTLTTFILYEISRHKDIQQKVQNECDSILRAHGGKITYEAIQSMEYTDKVMQETLRFYPPMGALIRKVTNDCILPLTDVQLQKETAVQIPIQGLHMDPEYFPDPERFDPERFSDEQKATRPSYVYMPFGEGPRICIGMRFAQVQIKSVLLTLFSRYNFELTKDTPVPMKFDPRGMVLTPAKTDFIITKRASINQNGDLK